MTAASILAAPKPVAALPGAMTAAAHGGEDDATFADMVAADSASVDAASKPPAKDISRAAPLSVSATHTLPPSRSLSTAEASAEPIDAPVAARTIVDALTMPAEDEATASADGEGVASIADLDLTTGVPVTSSAAFLSLLVAPPQAQTPAPATTNSSALWAAAAAGAALTDELAPAPQSDDAANADADADAAARQAAAAQALAATLPAPRAQLRPVDAAPLKQAPANASAAPASQADEAADLGSPPVISSQNGPTSGTSDQGATPAAAPVAQHAAVAPQAAIEPAAGAPVPAQPVIGGPASSPPASAPPAPVIVTNASNLSQVTVETTVQIAAQITRKLEGRSTRFEMGMTPEGLGRVNISLDIDSGGKLTARLAFDNPLAATEMRGKADELRRELQNAGFTVASDGLEFSQRQSSPEGGFERRQSRAFAGASQINADADLIQPSPAAWVSLSVTPRGVDMKV